VHVGRCDSALCLHHVSIQCFVYRIDLCLMPSISVHERIISVTRCGCPTACVHACSMHANMQHTKNINHITHRPVTDRIASSHGMSTHSLAVDDTHVVVSHFFALSLLFRHLDCTTVCPTWRLHRIRSPFVYFRLHCCLVTPLLVPWRLHRVRSPFACFRLHRFLLATPRQWGLLSFRRSSRRELSGCCER
jgi:hypothetical protein